MSSLSGLAEAGLIGRPERLGASEAAFVNAIAMNLLDFDNTHLPTVRRIVGIASRHRRDRRLLNVRRRIEIGLAGC